MMLRPPRWAEVRRFFDARSASIIMVVDPLTAGRQVDTSETQPFYNVTVAVHQQTAAILLRTGQ
jgi:hypothetical protein